MKSLALMTVLLAAISVAECREPAKSKLDLLTIHSAGLVGNAFGDSADQQVAVNLPPGYAQGTQRFSRRLSIAWHRGQLRGLDQLLRRPCDA
jgi:hypothetical protein